MQRFLLILKFLRALLLAARYDLRHEGFRSLFSSGWGVALALWDYAFSKEARADDMLVEQRQSACENCPVYCEALQTCGDARRIEEKDPLGCFCFIPVKARIKSAVCYLKEPEQVRTLRAFSETYGWPKEGTA